MGKGTFDKAYERGDSRMTFSCEGGNCDRDLNLDFKYALRHIKNSGGESLFVETDLPHLIMCEGCGTAYEIESHELIQTVPYDHEKNPIKLEEWIKKISFKNLGKPLVV
jgi:hypothetical protein